MMSRHHARAEIDSFLIASTQGMVTRISRPSMTAAQAVMSFQYVTIVAHQFTGQPSVIGFP